MVCVLLLLVRCVVGVLARGEISRPGGLRGQRRASPVVAATASQRGVGVAGVVAQDEVPVVHGAPPDYVVLGGGAAAHGSVA